MVLMPGKHGSDVSALVPVLNEAEILASFLERLRQTGVTETVVADGGSEDGSLEIARAVADRVVTSAPGRGRQIARAARSASAEIFWIVHCDCTPPSAAIEEIKETLARKGVLMGAFPISFDANHPLLRFYSILSRLDSPISTFGDQGFFLRSSDYRRAGGVPESALFEDVELRRRIRRLGKVAKTQSFMKTSARRFLKNGAFRQQVMNGVLLAQYYAGVNAETLAKSYRNSTISRVVD